MTPPANSILTIEPDTTVWMVEHNDNSDHGRATRIFTTEELTRWGFGDLHYGPGAEQDAGVAHIVATARAVLARVDGEQGT